MLKILNWLIRTFFRLPDETPLAPTQPAGTGVVVRSSGTGLMEIPQVVDVFAKSVQRSVTEFRIAAIGVGMDGKALAGTAMDDIGAVKLGMQGYSQIIPDAVVNWYSSQGFIGHQVCAILAQNWLIDKACNMPGKDAVRKGYEITVNDGTEVKPEVLDEMRKADVRYRLKKQMIEFIHKGRMFGIRIAMFVIDTPNPKDYYFKPFNIDGIKPGSYKGIKQIDPLWITPQLDGEAAGNPASLHFYEPTWWKVNDMQIHRSHLIIFRNGELADALKPTYFYGGIPLPQLIFNRIYCAERVADEAPQLALTKRTDVLTTDVEQALANPAAFQSRMQDYIQLRDNYGLKIVGLEDKMERLDTVLTDFDALVMTQYQLVAAVAKVPAVKLLGTSPKGFGASGEYEEANYHEELESTQEHDLSPLVERHHELLIRSEIVPMFNIAPFSTMAKWNSLDSMTAKESAEVQKIKADTGAVYVTSGAIDGADERNRITKDPDSGYNGLEGEAPIEEEDEEPEEVQGELSE